MGQGHDSRKLGADNLFQRAAARAWRAAEAAGTSLGVLFLQTALMPIRSLPHPCLRWLALSVLIGRGPGFRSHTMTESTPAPTSAAALSGSIVPDSRPDFRQRDEQRQDTRGVGPTKTSARRPRSRAPRWRQRSRPTGAAGRSDAYAWLGTDRHQSVRPCLSVTVLTTGRQRTLQEVDTVAYLYKAIPSGSPHFPVRGSKDKAVGPRRRK